MSTNKKSNRCFYNSSISEFYKKSNEEILGYIVSSFHGTSQTTTNDSWEEEIRILKDVLSKWKEEDAYILFEYSIPRLGKRIDVVLLYRGIANNKEN